MKRDSICFMLTRKAYKCPRENRCHAKDKSWHTLIFYSIVEIKSDRLLYIAKPPADIAYTNKQILAGKPGLILIALLNMDLFESRLLALLEAGTCYYSVLIAVVRLKLTLKSCITSYKLSADI